MEYIIALAIWGTSLVAGFDALGTAYETACESAGYEYHAFDEHEPTTYHCTGLPRRDK